MSIKVILVHLDHGSRSVERLVFAIDLARKQGAHLSGFYASGSNAYGLPEAEAAEVQRLFMEKTDGAGISADWIDGYEIDPPLTPLHDKFILRTRFADLIIIGQTAAGSDGRSLPADFVERVIISAGRPVLVLPKRGAFERFGERIMIAWSSGRIASRALHDAIPFLQKAKQVNLLMINSGKFYQSDIDSLTNYLGRNRINASCAMVTAKEPGTGDILLNQACDLGSDLLVVGLHYEFRRGHIDLGPVGRYLLEFMTIPLLISG